MPEPPTAAGRTIHELAFEALPERVVVLAADGTIRAANRGWREFAEERRVGLPDAGVGADYVTVANRAGLPDTPVIAAGLRDTADTGAPFRHQFCLGGRGGGVKWFEVRATRSPGSDPPVVVVTHDDITPRVEIRQRLMDREVHTRAILDTAADGVITITEAGVVESYNLAAQAIFGYTAAQVVGQNVSLLMASPYRDEHDGYLAQYVRTGRKTVIGTGREVWGRRQDGSTVPLMLSVSEVWLGDKRKFVGILRDITERLQAEETRSRLLRALLRAQEDERRRLARELHDGVGQALTSLRVGLHAIAVGRTQADGEQIARRLSDVATETLEEVRRLAHGLRPPVLDDLGLVAAVERLAAGFSAVHGVAVQVLAPIPAADRLPPEVESAAYRIVQEALANVGRHARATTVDVIVELPPGELRVVVEDDGVGFAPTARTPGEPGVGLTGMQERASLLGGQLTVASAPGRGTTIDARLPRSATPV